MTGRASTEDCHPASPGFWNNDARRVRDRQPILVVRPKTNANGALAGRETAGVRAAHRERQRAGGYVHALREHFLSVGSYDRHVGHRAGCPRHLATRVVIELADDPERRIGCVAGARASAVRILKLDRGLSAATDPKAESTAVDVPGLSTSSTL